VSCRAPRPCRDRRRRAARGQVPSIEGWFETVGKDASASVQPKAEHTAVAADPDQGVAIAEVDHRDMVSRAEPGTQMVGCLQYVASDAVDNHQAPIGRDDQVTDTAI